MRGCIRLHVCVSVVHVRVYIFHICVYVSMHVFLCEGQGMATCVPSFMSGLFTESGSLAVPGVLLI